MSRRFWLMKSEPHVYSIDDLQRDGRTGWEGVRNYQARNMMRDEMKLGDGVLFYHSSADAIGVAGLAEVVGEGRPDPAQFDETHKYHDAGSKPDEPRWYLVDVGFVEKFHEIVSLDTLKADPMLDGMLVTKKGQRLSVQPVDPAHYERVVSLGRAGA